MIYIMKITDLTNNQEQPLECFTTWRNLMGRFQDFVGNKNYRVVVRTQIVAASGDVVIDYNPTPDLV